jgi:hypothetical protein
MSDSINATVEQRLKKLEDALDRLNLICEASSRVSEQYEQSPEIRALSEKAALMEVLYEEGKKGGNDVNVINFMKACKTKGIKPEIVIEHVNSRANEINTDMERVQAQREIEKFAEKVKQVRIQQVALDYERGRRTYMHLKELCEEYNLTVSAIEKYFQSVLSNISQTKNRENHGYYSTILGRLSHNEDNL